MSQQLTHLENGRARLMQILPSLKLQIRTTDNILCIDFRETRPLRHYCCYCRCRVLIDKIQARPRSCRLPIMAARLYSSNQITKKDPKSHNRLSKFDMHDLSPIFLTIMLLHNLKVLQKPIKHHLPTIYWYNRADQILT